MPASFADLLPTIEEVGTDDEKIAAHFEQRRRRRSQDYRRRLAAYERYRKSEEYLKAVAEAEREAERVVTLASAPTRIPVSGAITLLRNDPKTQGPKLFAARCAGCHTHAAAAGGDERPDADRRDEIVGAESVRASPAARGWPGCSIPNRSPGPNYFGNTSHNEGEMVGFVNDTLAAWPAEEVAERGDGPVGRSAAHRARPRPTRKTRLASKPAENSSRDAEHCASCHKFHEHGELGSAPDLTGYGSREWLIGMISNPEARAILSRRQRPHAVVRRASGRLAAEHPQRAGHRTDRRLAARRVVRAGRATHRRRQRPPSKTAAHWPPAALRTSQTCESHAGRPSNRAFAEPVQFAESVQFRAGGRSKDATCAQSALRDASTTFARVAT